MKKPSIGIIGGTGKQGSGLAKYWALAGYEIRIGSRSIEKGKNTASKISEQITKLGSSVSISGGDNAYAADADVIVLAIPADQIDVLLLPLIGQFHDKIVIDITVNLKFGKFPSAQYINGKSSYEFVRDTFPNSRVVACFKTISSDLLATGEQINQVDFQQSLDKDALQLTHSLARIIGLRPITVRGKTHAHTIERMVALAIQVNKDYPGSHTGYLLVNVKN